VTGRATATVIEVSTEDVSRWCSDLRRRETGARQKNERYQEIPHLDKASMNVLACGDEQMLVGRSSPRA
jgi:hypothetical protein